MVNEIGARRSKVLIIDDDPLFRSMLASVMREKYIVFVAADGEEGYRKALAHPPHAIILDIRMPGWDGLKTLRTIRRNEVLAELPVMILSSDASRETVIAAIHSGATDYLIKTSFTKKEFHSKLARLIEMARDRALDRPSRRRLEEAWSRVRRVPSATPIPRENALPEPSPSPETANAPGAENSQLQEIMDAWE
ncbi:Chemotaxis protein CheY [Symmachiella macrocystis]|uniref:Chemotaxis protein CheY n=1 Tax=Symmachiella macrocystis TaxID=2527985 RepID=A0A5C6BTM1_9PLAN|nr:response regulator [Symmachiella macrocystis]TWU14821.1 Chemotaxis protein CheY [Symmachiella macrocystis]